MLVCWAILNYLLLPRMLHRSKVGFFLLTLLMLLVLMPLGSRFDVYIHQHFSSPNDVPLPEAERIPYYLLHIKYSILLILTTAATAINFLIDERKRQAAMFREQQMQEQLKYLRAQINPHFLFNALNCIYALTMMKDEQAPSSVLKLSEMLRYVIDDCRADAVPLTKEVKYIQNYIDFQRIRMEREPDLTLDVQISDPAYTIPPMLLQPIIENCFKHSRLIDDPKAWVRISIRQNDSGLLFISDNSKPSATNFSRQSAIIGRQDEERTGIGLMNVQQRLAVLFGDKCSLKVIEDNSHYKTVLHI
jgi:sensor histidine kinase YesM